MTRRSRLLAAVLLCGLVAFAGGWTRGRALPPPPRCPSGVTNPPATPHKLWPWLLHVPTPGLPGGHPLYLRFCGPAHAVVRLNRRAYTITSGNCDRAPGPEGEGIGVGLMANPPASPARGLTIDIHTAIRAGTIPTGAGPLVYIALQLPGLRSGIAGKIIIDASTHAGRINGRLDDGTPVTGSWTCG